MNSKGTLCLSKTTTTKNIMKLSAMRERRRLESTGIIKGPQKKSTCPHCNKSSGVGIMKQWHFDRCKATDANS